MGETIPVFYDVAQVSEPQSFSPSAAKPRKVVEGWQRSRLPITVLKPEPLTPEQLALAHDPDYVSGVLRCEIPNGFRTKDPQVAASLPWTTGSMLSAARHALQFGGVAVSPTSGFHHAGFASASGFCTFNGLMTTVATLRNEGAVRKVGILDCDEHYGDGTEEIIDTLGLRSEVVHITAGPGYPRHPRKFLSLLPELVAGFADCDLLLYQAGADPHIDDAFGGWLTTEQLFERDCTVFSTARAMKLPTVWNLAGGYQDPVEDVVMIHDNTMIACINAFLGERWELQTY